MDLTYQFYTDIWGGSLPESTFNTFMIRAKYILNCITGHKLNTYWDRLTQEQQEAIMMALCAIIDNQYQAYQTGGRDITLEIVGQHHVSYSAPTESESIRIKHLIQPYLCGIYLNGYPLMYRGIRKRCCWC